MTDDLIAGDGADDAAVIAVIPVVAHDEILVFRKRGQRVGVVAVVPCSSLVDCLEPPKQSSGARRW